MATVNDNRELMSSEEFDSALLQGVEYKKNILTSYKDQNKTNYDRFVEVMFEANQEIKNILSKKRKDRTDQDTQKVKDFKRSLTMMYRHAQELTIDEHLEEGKKTKIERIVEKVMPVIDILRYIGCTKLDDEFAKRGISIATGIQLEDKYPVLDSDEKRAVMRDIFNNATSIKQRMLDDDDRITSEVFITRVPTDLQYDKSTNNTGLKQNDFKKLVDMKTKLVMATSDEAKEKVEDTIEQLAGEKQFEMARAEMLRDKLTQL